MTNTLTLNYAAFSKETKIKLYVTSEKLDPTIYNTILMYRAPDKEKIVEANVALKLNIL